MYITDDLSKEGFLLLKKDRQELLNQISELKSLLDGFDFVYPFLESLYEPKFDILTKENKYVGSISIMFPTLDEPILREFEIGLVSSYDGKENAVLIEDGYIKANELLKSMFPLHFPNNDTDK
jgi:hypothetical protein